METKEIIKHEYPVEDFIGRFHEWINSFEFNMKNLKSMSEAKKTNEEWMETFLRWIEWRTEMHNWYWK